MVLIVMVVMEMVVVVVSVMGVLVVVVVVVMVVVVTKGLARGGDIGSQCWQGKEIGWWLVYRATD